MLLKNKKIINIKGLSLGAIFSLYIFLPYFKVLHYGVNFFEIFLIIYFFVCLAKNKILKPPQVIITFCLFLTSGYIGSLINGSLFWDVKIGFWNLNYFYKIFLGFSAFALGYQSASNLKNINNDKLLVACVFFIFFVVLAYPFLNLDQKIYLFSPYFPEENSTQYFTSSRFPGTGINNVSFAFIILSLLILTHSYKSSKKFFWINNTLLLLTIFLLQSKLNIFLAFLFFLIFILLKKYLYFELQTKINPNNFILYFGLFVGIFGLFKREEILNIFAGSINRIALALRGEDINQTNELVGFQLRFFLMSEGLKRIILAPILGIASYPFQSFDINDPVSFYNPHNEFLRIWTFYGILGLIAWLYLIYYFVVLNLRNKAHSFVFLFFAFLVFLFFDGGIDNPRFVSFFFLILGLNHGYLTNRQALR